MTPQEFKTVLQKHPTVLVKFSAKWCGPCKAMEPGLVELEAQSDFPPVVRVDVEDDMDVATQYNIRAMPTLMLFENAQAVKTQVGALSMSQLQSFVHDRESPQATTSLSLQY